MCRSVLRDCLTVAPGSKPGLIEVVVWVAMADERDVPYQALYRRFRPQRFSDVVGQDHVTRPLKAAVRDGKVAHAYLFSGPRGTGKTSTARILAMALNCENPTEGEPDGRCQSCVAIRQGSSLDVQELDSATNRGIDEMRDLLSRVALGTPGRWKVYIIDEVHQMTSAASSALLKTLEEPPEHVIFVLATTDPQKVLETIRSRTQHFEFRLLGTDALTSLLSDVAGRAEIDLPADTMDVVVRRGHGSARDALSALDQVAAAGEAHDEVAAVLDIVDALVERAAGKALQAVAAAAMQGLDPRRLGTELIEYLRNGFLATRAPSLVLLMADSAAEAEARARALGPANLVRAMEVIGQALIDMREAADPRTTLEVALVRLAAPEVDNSPAALLARIERLESAAGSKTSSDPRPARAPAASSAPAEVGAPPPMPGTRAPAPGSRSALGAHRQAPPRKEATPAAGEETPPVREEASRGREETPRGRGETPRGRTEASSGGEGAGPGPVENPAPPNRSESSGGLPTRDELTMAWGDKVLSSLRPAVKVYMASGRFVSSEEGMALYAVPDRGLLSRAEPNLGEIEAALAAHFGRPVPLKLVLDDGSWKAAASTEEAPEDVEVYDLDDLQEAPASAAVTPEQRLLEAFPGAEEV